MCEMSRASEISPNVFLGPTPDPTFDSSDAELNYDLLIEASDLAQIPDISTLKTLETLLDEPDHGVIQLEFPSSGSIMPPNWSHTEVDGLLETCRWIYNLANPSASPSATPDSVSPTTVPSSTEIFKDADGDSIMLSNPASIPSPSTETCARQPHKILLHCSDGYTESTLLGLAYYMYSHGVPAHTAWLQLHRDRGRNFFAYPCDVALLTSIQPRILQESPVSSSSLSRVDSLLGSGSAVLNVDRLTEEPAWLQRMDGSLPSRILPYMYLGNLGHANNPQLLKELGISRILSVGEPVNWKGEVEALANGAKTEGGWGKEDLLFIDRVQDNGVDPLTEEFGRCLEFIGMS